MGQLTKLLEEINNKKKYHIIKKNEKEEVNGRKNFSFFVKETGHNVANGHSRNDFVRSGKNLYRDKMARVHELSYNHDHLAKLFNMEKIPYSKYNFRTYSSLRNLPSTKDIARELNSFAKEKNINYIEFE